MLKRIDHSDRKCGGIVYTKSNLAKPTILQESCFADETNSFLSLKNFPQSRHEIRRKIHNLGIPAFAREIRHVKDFIYFLNEQANGYHF